MTNVELFTIEAFPNTFEIVCLFTVHMMSLFCAGHVHSGHRVHHSGQWTVSTVFSLVVRVTFPTLAASLPPAPATLATATDAPVTGYIQQILRSAHAIALINLS